MTYRYRSIDNDEARSYIDSGLRGLNTMARPREQALVIDNLERRIELLERQNTLMIEALRFINEALDVNHQANIEVAKVIDAMGN